MSEDGFKTDDLSSTLARFASKRRNIIQDESRLERKIQEPVTFSSATQNCGAAILASTASLLTLTHEHIDESYEPVSSEGWMHGSQGYGYYRNGVKD